MEYVPEHKLNDILSSSIDAEAHLNITRKTDEGWQLLKSKFQGTVGQAIKIASPITTYGLEKELHGLSAVSFRKGHKKMIFQTICNQDTLVWPSTMVEVARRIYERQEPQGSETVRFWKSNATRNVCHGELTNISGGGIGVKTSYPFPEGEYVCAVDVDPQITVEALLKQFEPCGKRFVLSFQFLGIDLDPIPQLARIQKAHRRLCKKATRCQSGEVWTRKTVAESIEELHLAELH